MPFPCTPAEDFKTHEKTPSSGAAFFCVFVAVSQPGALYSSEKKNSSSTVV